MSFKIIPTDHFIRETKQLARKYPSIKGDLQILQKQLLGNPFTGVHLGKNVYKIRLAITSKGKGKSGGARVLTFLYIKAEQIFLLSIYDKSQKQDVKDQEIRRFLKNIPFQE